MSFSLSFALDEEFEILGPDLGFLLDQTVSNQVEVVFALAKWLAFNSASNDKGVDFRDLTLVSGAINLDETSNGDNQKVWEVIRKAIKDSAEMEKRS